MLTHDEILKIILDLKVENPVLNKYGGLGFCIYGSILLHRVLLDAGTRPILLTARTFKDTRESQRNRNFLKDMILNITDASGVYYGVRKTYLDKQSLANDTGHAVVLVGDTIYDITSAQFGLPSSYAVSELAKMWVDIRETDCTIDFSRVFYAGKMTYGNKLKIVNNKAGFIKW